MRNLNAPVSRISLLPLTCMGGGAGFSEGIMLIGDTPERFRALFGF
jgi:hypothetical protein